jgi:hypothetical protein
MRRAPGMMLVIILIATAAAAAILVHDALVRPATKQTEEFQRLVGGLGFGPTIHLDVGEQWFDPRLVPDESAPPRDSVLPSSRQFGSILEYPLPAPAPDPRTQPDALHP